jgi:NAD(P)-dependent dehydrogenase (short-subunit alcohol dehydrogenase family)
MATVRKAVLITGCDTGFGFSLALHSAENLASKNILTIAACFRPDDEGCQILKNHPKFCPNFITNEEGKSLFVIPLDVTDDESIKVAEKKVNKILQVFVSNQFFIKYYNKY